MHLRYPDTFAGTAAYVAKLTGVFAALNTGVDFVEASSAPVGGGRLDAIDTGRCSAAPTAEVVALFNDFAPQPLGGDDVTVFFAGQLNGGATLGCANHPGGCRGVIVSCQADEMVLPHEIAHLFLGDIHNHTNHQNLMWPNTDEIIDPPKLTTAQRVRIRTGDWATVAAPPVVMEVEMANGVGTLTTVKAKKTRKKKKRRR